MYASGRRYFPFNVENYITEGSYKSMLSSIRESLNDEARLLTCEANYTTINIAIWKLRDDIVPPEHGPSPSHLNCINQVGREC